MLNENSSISLRFADEFEINLSKLAKKYRHIRSDIQPIIEELQRGNFTVHRLAGMGESPLTLHCW